MGSQRHATLSQALHVSRCCYTTCYTMSLTRVIRVTRVLHMCVTCVLHIVPPHHYRVVVAASGKQVSAVEREPHIRHVACVRLELLEATALFGDRVAVCCWGGE